MKRLFISSLGLCLLAACAESGGDSDSVADAAVVEDLGARLILDQGGGDGAVVDLGTGDAAGDSDGGPEVDGGPQAACADGLDNDRDGLVDFPDDPGCESADDDDETDPPPPDECTDGLDNDGDEFVDAADPDCAGFGDRTESGDNVPKICSNGVDDDADGLIDFPFDPGCPAAGHNNESDPAPAPACANDADDDGDGMVDFPEDPGCVAAGDEDEATPEPAPACADGQDNNGDGTTDWPADPGCDGAGDLTESSPCGASGPIVDLNAHLAENLAWTGDLNDSVAALTGTCGGEAGGEFIFRYQVERQLDRLVFDTDHPETEAPVVMYVRDRCIGGDLACARGRAGVPGVELVMEDVAPGQYFLVVDTGNPAVLGPVKLTVDAVLPPACRDAIDNDEDGLLDLADTGCVDPEDGDETDPAEVPVCANGVDDDMDGQTDWPEDVDCTGAGGPEEAPPCALNAPILRAGQEGGEFPLDVLQGAGAAQGGCEGALGPETVIVLTLRDPSDVELQVLTADGEPALVSLHARAVCEDPETEEGCRTSAARAEPLTLIELDRGVHYLFAEQGIAPPPGGLTARVLVQSAITECNDLIDNDDDGLIDLADVGCTMGRDPSELDPAEVPQCADGIDNDMSGQADWPDDEGCAAAGDPEEAPLGIPLGRERGFGHHGSCNTFNACNDAQTCANAACRFYGHGDALSFEEGLCQDLARMIPGMRCSLFRSLPDSLDENWANGCNIPVAYDILCAP